MMMNLAVDDRSFEQKYGDHCPFCGTSWNDRNTCGRVDPGWSWREQMNASFRNRANRPPPDKPRSERVCVRCLSTYQGVAGQLYCSKRCADQVRTQRYSDAHAVTKKCAWCGGSYKGRTTSRYCSHPHANLAQKGTKQRMSNGR